MILEELVDRFSELTVTVLGDPILDHYIAGDCNRVSPEAPVPVILIEEEDFIPGGAANVAVNLARLGAQVKLVAPLATDEHGVWLTELLTKEGVDLSFSLPSAARTVTKTRITARAQQVCRIDAEDKPEAYKVDLKKYGRDIAGVVGGSDACIVADYGKGVISDHVMTMLRECRKGNPRLFLAFDPHPSHTIDCLGMNLITPNLHEAHCMAREKSWVEPDDPEGLVEVLHNIYCPENLAITLGPDGIILGREGEVVDTMAAMAQEVFDVSGAGDAVVSVMTLALKMGAPLQTAAALANLAAGFVVSKVGTFPINATDLKMQLHRSAWGDHEFELAV